MKKSFLFLLIAFAGLSACSNQSEYKKPNTLTGCIDSSKVRKDAVCVDTYQPVCGCDGQTYTNECVAANAGVTSWDNGACQGKGLLQKEDKK